MLRGDAFPTSKETLELRLFGCWDLRAGSHAVPLGGREQRLVALLALRGRRARSQIAGTLWSDESDDAQGLAKSWPRNS